jgi:hypothetical protein
LFTRTYIVKNKIQEVNFTIRDNKYLETIFLLSLLFKGLKTIKIVKRDNKKKNKTINGRAGDAYLGTNI